jgi:hypothetical protein
MNEQPAAIWSALLWLAAAALLLLYGIAEEEEVVAAISAFAGGVGSAQLYAYARSQFTITRVAEPGAPRVRELEQRLVVSESELASLAEEVRRLRAARDFDEQLHSGQ